MERHLCCEGPVYTSILKVVAVLGAKITANKCFQRFSDQLRGHKRRSTKALV
jgi:hypothetical protein